MILAETVDPVTVVRWVFDNHLGDVVAVGGIILGAIGTLVRRRRARTAAAVATPVLAPRLVQALQARIAAAAAPTLSAPAPDAPRRRTPPPAPPPAPVPAAMPGQDDVPRQERLARPFGDASSLRAAVIAAEVLGTPVGLR